MESAAWSSTGEVHKAMRNWATATIKIATLIDEKARSRHNSYRAIKFVFLRAIRKRNQCELLEGNEISTRSLRQPHSHAHFAADAF